MVNLQMQSLETQEHRMSCQFQKYSPQACVHHQSRAFAH